MVMNKRGQTLFFVFMIGVVFFFLGVNLAKPTVDVTKESMLQLNCTTNYLVNDTITNQDRAYCTAIDMFAPLFVGLCFGLGASLIAYLGVR
jgi:hypothetical protein